MQIIHLIQVIYLLSPNAFAPHETANVAIAREATQRTSGPF